MSSAKDYPEVVVGYLQAEDRKGRLVGPLHPPCTQIHTSPFGVIRKHNQLEKWRLITDLSSPPGSSINDVIDPTLCSIDHSGMVEAIAMVCRLGRGCLLAKTNLKNVQG